MLRVFLFCVFLVTLTFSAPTKKENLKSSNSPWENFEFAVDLDSAGKYWMFWTPDDETQTITFEVHVEALGYVGFGLSPNGGMTGADVVIGWVNDDGTAVFHDRHALGEYEPIIDESQDVTLISANQNDTHTILRFSRPYVTCDENDMDVTIDTVRIIYSYTDTDPEDITGLSYHGSSNRGTKSVVLLSYHEGDPTLPDDAIAIDLLVNEVEIPRKRTTYWCEMRKLPRMDQKQHVVMFEPVVKQGNEGVVHHIVIYVCTGEIEEEVDGDTWDCIWNVMPVQNQCSTTAFVWAVGGNPFYFPEHTGFPMFETDQDVYVRIEMHYDNPDHIDGIMDNSGMRLHVTPTLREHDIGLISAGMTVDNAMMIPPHYDAFKYRGYCLQDCLETTLNTTDSDTSNDQLNVFAVYQHAHLLGRKIKTRLYRDGTEVEPLLVDNNYDFNFQETRLLKEEVQVGPNDMLVIDCEYDSSQEDKVTFGGLATKNEMCITIVYYYPANPTYVCNTRPTLQRALQVVDNLQLEMTSQWPHFTITAPEEFAGMSTQDVFRSLDWTNQTLREEYQELVLEENADMYHICASKDGALTTPLLATSPELGEDWVNPDDGLCDEAKVNAANDVKEKEAATKKKTQKIQHRSRKH